MVSPLPFSAIGGAGVHVGHLYAGGVHPVAGVRVVGGNIGSVQRMSPAARFGSGKQLVSLPNFHEENRRNGVSQRDAP